jgi:hypothetical protein
MRLLVAFAVLAFAFPIISSSAQTKHDEATKQDQAAALIRPAGSCVGISSGNQLNNEEVQTCVQIEAARVAAAVGLPKTAQQLICTAPLVVKLNLQGTCKAESAAQNPPPASQNR